MVDFRATTRPFPCLAKRIGVGGEVAIAATYSVEKRGCSPYVIVPLGAVPIRCQRWFESRRTR